MEERNNSTTGVAFGTKPHAVIMQWSRWFDIEKNRRQSVLQGGGRPSKAASNCLMVLQLAVCPAKLFIFAREKPFGAKLLISGVANPKKHQGVGLPHSRNTAWPKSSFYDHQACHAQVQNQIRSLPL